VCDEYSLGAAARREALDLVGASFDLTAGFVRRRVDSGDAAFVERPDRLGGPQRFERRRLWWQCRRVTTSRTLSGEDHPGYDPATPHGGTVVDMNLGAPELLILSLGVVPFAVNVWGLVDASSRPGWAWQRSGQNQTLWIVLMVVGLFTCLVGAALALLYLLAIRPQVAAQQSTGPDPGPPPPPPPPAVPLA
jgi:hypothetical protein